MMKKQNNGINFIRWQCRVCNQHLKVWRSKIIQSLMDEELEQPVLSFLNGEEGWDTDYSSISEFKHYLKEDTLADEELQHGWVFWRENEQQLNNTTQLQHKITTLFKHLPFHVAYMSNLIMQFWSVVKVEGRRHYQLSSSHHPFFVSHLKKGYCWYRKLCMDHMYPVEMDGTVEEAQLGGVGRAYRNKHPESTPDLRLYSTNEFPLRDPAAGCGFRFYLALPLYDLHNMNECYGVLEILSDCAGMDTNLMFLLTEKLQIAGLRSTHINFNPITNFEDEMPDIYKQQVDDEIKELLETVIQALPRLSLAQVWVYRKQCVNNCCMERASFIAAPNKIVNSYDDIDQYMFHYLDACVFQYMFDYRYHFHQNLKDRSISKNPLEHYAQMARLSHCFAIYMQSVDNNNDPFVIEFFLQPECSSLYLLARIIHMKLKSFKCVGGEQQLLEIFQSIPPNEIECESIDMLKVMNFYEEEFSESNFKEYMDTVDDTCCQRPTSVDSQEGWVFSCPSRERLCENHVYCNTVFVPLLLKERLEEFMKKMAIQSGRGRYWIAQFWAPKMAEGRCYLETSAQPYALGYLAKGLASFRKECMKHHYFVDDEAKEEELGPPGRVFRNKHTEITSDLLLYSTKEFPMRNYAMHCCLQEYLVLPVFDELKNKCAGVLEFIGFDYFKLEDIGRALKAAKLRSTDHIHFQPDKIMNYRTAEIKWHLVQIINYNEAELKEVSDAFSLFTEIPHLHRAKMWVPNEKCVCISSNASCMKLALLTKRPFPINYMPTDEVQWIHVQPRKGIIGMALESESKSCFCQDLSGFNIIDQPPLALIDRSERVDVCFAIGLQSSLTGDLTYVLEFFLKPSPQYLDSFFKFLLAIMKQKLKSFKYACGKQLGEELVVDVIQFSEANNLAFPELGQRDDVPIKFRSVQYCQMEHQQAEEAVQYVSDGMQTEQCRVAAAFVSKKTEKGKRKTCFHLRLEDLKPHFGKKLKDVELELGVGRSTIKRACRDHGIKRWPCTEKQTKNPCIYEKEKEQDSHQDEQPSSSGNLQLRDTSLHQNGPCTKTESLIVLEEEVEKGSPKKKAHKAVVKERKVMSFDSLPLPLKILRSYAENELNDGRSIPVDLDDEVFGNKCKIYVHLDDIIPFCDLEPISGNCIVVYIWQLYNKIKKENTLRRFQFVNPFTISYVPNGKLTQRVYKLVDRLIVASPDQLVLVPCNVGEHWILTVIEPYKNVVYMLDPISHYIRDEAWKCAVDQAMIKFNANLEKGDTGQPTWEAIKVPLQPDFKQCGYYVMRFMKEIVQGLNAIDSGSLSSLFVNEEYSRTDIDEVRIEWTNCLTNTRVGRSTIKRVSRYHSIGRWPCNEKQTRNPSLYEQDSQQDVQPSSSGNLRQLDASLHQNGPRTNTESLIVQEEVEKVMMIKVRSEEDIIKFELCLSLGVDKLLEEVATRLYLKMGTFKLKYLDEYKDEILVRLDADLQLCLKSQKTMGKNCIELLLR